MYQAVFRTVEKFSIFSAAKGNLSSYTDILFIYKFNHVPSYFTQYETIQHMGSYRLHHEYKLQALFEVYRIPHCIIEYANASKSDFIVNDRCSAIFAFFGGKLRFVSGSVANPNSDPIRFV